MASCLKVILNFVNCAWRVGFFVIFDDIGTFSAINEVFERTSDTESLEEMCNQITKRTSSSKKLTKQIPRTASLDKETAILAPFA